MRNRIVSAEFEANGGDRFALCKKRVRRVEALKQSGVVGCTQAGCMNDFLPLSLELSLTCTCSCGHVAVCAYICMWGRSDGWMGSRLVDAIF